MIRKPLWNRGGGVFVEETAWPQSAARPADLPADAGAGAPGAAEDAAPPAVSDAEPAAATTPGAPLRGRRPALTPRR